MAACTYFYHIINSNVYAVVGFTYPYSNTFIFSCVVRNVS